jgi:hypothetical protein
MGRGFFDCVAAGTAAIDLRGIWRGIRASIVLPCLKARLSTGRRSLVHRPKVTCPQPSILGRISDIGKAIIHFLA